MIHRINMLKTVSFRFCPRMGVILFMILWFWGTAETPERCCFKSLSVLAWNQRKKSQTDIPLLLHLNMAMRNLYQNAKKKHDSSISFKTSTQMPEFLDVSQDGCFHKWWYHHPFQWGFPFVNHPFGGVPHLWKLPHVSIIPKPSHPFCFFFLFGPVLFQWTFQKRPQRCAVRRSLECACEKNSGPRVFSACCFTPLRL